MNIILLIIHNFKYKYYIIILMNSQVEIRSNTIQGNANERIGLGETEKDPTPHGALFSLLKNFQNLGGGLPHHPRYDCNKNG